MTRQLLKDTCETARAIMAGELDADLNYIVQAARARTKNVFRPGALFTLVGTKNVELEGKTATVIRVNSKTVVVGVGVHKTDIYGGRWSEGEYNVPPSMLTSL